MYKAQIRIKLVNQILRFVGGLIRPFSAGTIQGNEPTGTVGPELCMSAETWVPGAVSLERERLFYSFACLPLGKWVGGGSGKLKASFPRRCVGCLNEGTLPCHTRRGLWGVA